MSEGFGMISQLTDCEREVLIAFSKEGYIVFPAIEGRGVSEVKRALASLQRKQLVKRYIGPYELTQLGKRIREQLGRRVIVAGGNDGD